MSPGKHRDVGYYIRTAQGKMADAQRAQGGLGEHHSTDYYGEHGTRPAVWMVAGQDTARVAELFGLTAAQAAGGAADLAVVERWIDEGIAPSGASGRAFGRRDNHFYDVTIAVPKSVSLMLELGADERREKMLGIIREGAQEGLNWLAETAAFTRVHNAVSGQKDFQKLPGLVGAAFLHETNRHGEPHVHIHLLVGRQVRADGTMAAVDKYEFGEAMKTAGIIAQAHWRRDLHLAYGVEWTEVDENGQADIAGISRESIEAWSTSRTRLMDWAMGNLETVEEGQLTVAQTAAAQKAVRPPKPEELSSETLRAGWRADPRGLKLDMDAHRRAKQARIEYAKKFWGAVNTSGRQP
ncbi:MAG TPA: MobF family relaxase, partial [Mycobacterium sp.]|nr:MobF family relaxase [Mycobacterium sp.]